MSLETLVVDAAAFGFTTVVFTRDPYFATALFSALWFILAIPSFFLAEPYPLVAVPFFAAVVFGALFGAVTSLALRMNTLISVELGGGDEQTGSWKSFPMVLTLVFSGFFLAYGIVSLIEPGSPIAFSETWSWVIVILSAVATLISLAVIWSTGDRGGPQRNGGYTIGLIVAWLALSSIPPLFNEYTFSQQCGTSAVAAVIWGIIWLATVLISYWTQYRSDMRFGPKDWILAQALGVLVGPATIYLVGGCVSSNLVTISNWLIVAMLIGTGVMLLVWLVRVSYPDVKNPVKRV